MIFGNKNQLNEFSFIEEKLKQCFEYANTHDLSKFENGCYEIDGKDCFVNIVEYTTTTPEERFWESHKVYLDVHMVFRGSEQIDLNFVQNMREIEWKESEDMLLLEGEKNASVILRDGDFLILYPQDAHRTSVAVDAAEKIKKAVFKVRI